MKFVQDVEDFGAPEFCVAGVSAVERISAGMVRVSFFTRRKDGLVDCVHTVWDMVEWRKTFEMVSRACEGVLAETPLSGDDHPARHAH
jgi:hypothetical protein